MMSSRSPAGHPLRGKGPLSHIRIADFCWVGVGACATRLLADFGAEVIKIEDRTRLDMTRRLPVYKGEAARSFGDEDVAPNPDRSGIFNNYNRNKLSLTINMRTARGRELVEQLISKSSVVTENFAPGVMERWGLDYEAIRKLRPDAIFARMSGFGHSGPNENYRSYGPIVQAVCGLSFISGLAGREPSGWGMSYMDNQAAYYSSAAILMAIYNRAMTGKGTAIDMSAVEIGAKILGPLMLDVAVNGRETRGPEFPTGNRLEHPHAAPHGVYAVEGEDRWLAIAVFNDQEWAAFTKVAGDPEWARDPLFATQQSRFDNHDALDRHVAAWCATQRDYDAMFALQAAGVRAAVCQNARDLNDFDPQLAERGVFFKLDHPVIGEATFEGTPIAFSGMKQTNWRSGPLLGEDTAYILETMLGVGADEYAELKEQGVV